MFQKFNFDTLQTNFIKYILSETNLLTISFTNSLEYVTPGVYYVHEGYIIKINIKGEDLRPYKISEITSEDYIKFEPYIFGKEYPGLTTKYISSSNSYDSETHYYLGLYLRMLKGCYKVDLMPFYNCYCNEFTTSSYSLEYYSEKEPEDIYLGSLRVTKTTTDLSNYKFVSVPIKFGEKYTVALSSEQPVELVPCFVDKNGVLINETDELLKCVSHMYGNVESSRLSNFLKKCPVSFQKPQVFHMFDLPAKDIDGDIVIDGVKLHSYEKFLRLVIKLPKKCDSSVVVLNGVYQNTDTYTDRIISTSFEDIQDECRSNSSTCPNTFAEYLNSYLYTNLSLLRLNDTNTYAFTSRLIEYLCNNVITSSEKLQNNIKLIQSSVYSEGVADGIYTDSLRLDIFNTVNEFINQYSRSNIVDMNGFVDKDTESILASELYKRWRVR